jgi:hypothetical protein
MHRFEGGITMRSKQLVVLVIVATLSFAVGSTIALAAGATAKAGLEQAQQTATKWKADAALVNISTLAANMDGTAQKWGYMFYSAKAKLGYTVDVRDGKIAETVEVGPYISDPIGGNFVDSPQAMEEAKKEGLKVKGKPGMSLLIMGQATKTPGAYWTVSGYMAGEVSVTIDAKTGKFSARQEVPKM